MGRNKFGHTVIRVLFFLYCGIMLCMLFGRSAQNSGADYLHSIRENINIIPMKTTMNFIRAFIAPSDSDAFRRAWINLFGNIVVFVPLGIFLPVIWQNQGRSRVFFTTASIVILAVEFLQLFTLRGICDVDDYLLNMLGLFAGFALFHLCSVDRKPE